MRIALLFAVLTGTVISVFQLYWLKKTYNNTQSDFIATANLLLNDALNAGISASRNNTLPNENKVMFINNDTLFFEKVNGIPQPVKQINDQHLVIDGKISHLSKDVAKDTATITAIYRKLLLNKGIQLPVTITIEPPHPYNTTDAVKVPTERRAGSPLLEAHFRKIPRHIIKKILPAIEMSAFLILLTFCSLYFMYHNLRRQIQMDIMKNNFIANMTHELRTPVSILRSTHEALNQFGYIYDTERAIRYLQANQDVLNQLNKNIDRILTISTIEKKSSQSHLVDTNLKKILEKASSIFAELPDITIHLSYQLPNNVLPIDATAIETSVINVIENAIKYSNKPVRITVTVTSTPDGWKLSIEDNGIGIERQHLPYLFDRFYRVPTGNVHNVKGFGLGLHHGKQLIEKSGGTIKVASEPEKGSTFTFEFHSDENKGPCYRNFLCSFGKLLSSTLYTKRQGVRSYHNRK